MRHPLASGPLLAALAALLLAPSPVSADPASEGVSYFDVHRAFGTLALGSFATSLVIGSATGNLGKLMDPQQCCPDGGNRQEFWRTTDRVLVTTGIVAYTAAAAMASYNLLIRDPPSENPRVMHQAHRWLALAHGAAFVTSAVTGLIMFTLAVRQPRPLRRRRPHPHRQQRAAGAAADRGDVEHPVRVNFREGE